MKSISKSLRSSQKQQPPDTLPLLLDLALEISSLAATTPAEDPTKGRIDRTVKVNAKAPEIYHHAEAKAAVTFVDSQWRQKC